MNIDWKVEEGIVVGRTSDNTSLFPNAEELFNSSDIITINGKEYPFNISGVRFSRLTSAKFVLKLCYENNTIKLFASAIKNNKEVNVGRVNNKFLNYCIIDNVCYYVDSSIDDLNNKISELEIDTNNINFKTYIDIVNFVKEQQIEYKDNVNENLKNIQNNVETIENDILYPYQRSGVNWLSYMVDNQCGCILADSMGLGKTPEIIFLVSHMKKANKNVHCLIVAPVSLLENWRREIIKFCPDLKCRVNYGEDKISYYKDLLDYDVIVDSYNGVQRWFGVYQMITWDAVILDEAQNIKNPDANRTKTVKELNKKLGIAVTGTPFENHLTDIWSLTDFAIPNYMGTKRDFEKQYSDDENSAYEIEKQLSPIMIRRKVEEVAKDLPERTDIAVPIRMTMDEAKRYDAELRNVAELKSFSISKMTKLRMFCSHPQVYDNGYEGIDPYTLSEKYQRCCEIVSEIVDNEEKVIIFTTFNEMINILKDDLHSRFNVPTLFINGDVKVADRQPIIDRFSEIEGSAILILNPKAAGAGLNITAANHVIHYNLEWNPALEDQASARAYRRGQEKKVFVYRLHYINTIEEVINDRLELKRTLSDIAVVGNNGEMNSEDVARILTLSPLSK